MSDPIVFLPGSMNFESIREFKDCIIRGGEPVFAWKGVCYGVCFHGEGYCIAPEDGKGEQLCKTPDEVLEYIVSGDRLRDVITQVTVIDRSL